MSGSSLQRRVRRRKRVRLEAVAVACALQVNADLEREPMRGFIDAMNDLGRNAARALNQLITQSIKVKVRLPDPAPFFTLTAEISHGGQFWEKAPEAGSPQGEQAGEAGCSAGSVGAGERPPDRLGSDARRCDGQDILAGPEPAEHPEAGSQHVQHADAGLGSGHAGERDGPVPAEDEA